MEFSRRRVPIAICLLLTILLCVIAAFSVRRASAQRPFSNQMTPSAPQAGPEFKLGPDYKFDSKTSPGLITDTLVFPNGSKLTINFPNDIAVGDTFSGT